MKVEDTSIPRFKLATINKKDKYLIDLDSHKSTWLIPMPTWYVANNATKISEDQYIKFKKVPKNKVGTSINIHLFSVFVIFEHVNIKTYGKYGI